MHIAQSASVACVVCDDLGCEHCPKVERPVFCAPRADDGLPCPSCDTGRTTEALARRAVTLICLAGGNLDVLQGRELSAWPPVCCVGWTPRR